MPASTSGANANLCNPLAAQRASPFLEKRILLIQCNKIDNLCVSLPSGETCCAHAGDESCPARMANAGAQMPESHGDTTRIRVAGLLQRLQGSSDTRGRKHAAGYYGDRYILLGPGHRRWLFRGLRSRIEKYSLLPRPRKKALKGRRLFDNSLNLHDDLCAACRSSLSSSKEPRRISRRTIKFAQGRPTHGAVDAFFTRPCT